MRFRFGRHVLPAVFSCLALCAALPAADQPAPNGKDLLDEARRRDQVAEQKAETDFRAALLELNKLEGANPARAAERLKKVLAVLDEDTTLRPEKREAWKRVVKDRIRVTEAEADRAAKEGADDASRQASKDDRQTADDAKRREEERLRQDLEKVRQMQREGNSEGAERLANEIAERNPKSPAAVAGRHISGIAGAIRENEALKRERDRRDLIAMRQVIESAMPSINEIEFPSPAKWKEITKRRTKTDVTEQEKAILKALDSPISARFDGSTLEAVIDYLQTLTGVPIVLDKKTLEDVGASYDTPVNVRLGRPVALRTVLRKVLGEVPGNLTYIVEKETIHIVTLREAQTKMTTRTYYLGDMAFVGDYTFGPLFSRASMVQAVTDLINTIVSTIEPDSWHVNNPEAKGTITFNPTNLTLIVRQSAEIHYMLGGGR